MAQGVDHHEQTLFDHTHELVAIFVVTASCIGMDDSFGIKKCPCGIGEIESALCEARFAFGFISLEIHKKV